MKTLISLLSREVPDKYTSKVSRVEFSSILGIYMNEYDTSKNSRNKIVRRRKIRKNIGENSYWAIKPRIPFGSRLIRCARVITTSPQ